MGGKAIVLFDGVCNLCNGSVQFIIRRDAAGFFQFASLQGGAGQALMAKYRLEGEMSSIVLIENDRVYLKSDAVLRICRHLKGGWRLLVIFRIVPRPLRNLVYDFIARNRYRWFGKQDTCMLPTPDIKNRFLEE